MSCRDSNDGGGADGSSLRMFMSIEDQIQKQNYQKEGDLNEESASGQSSATEVQDFGQQYLFESELVNEERFGEVVQYRDQL